MEIFRRDSIKIVLEIRSKAEECKMKITLDKGAKMPTRAECWCFGAPCQDFCVAGRRAGLDGDRSSLVREIFRLLEEQEEQNRPEWLIYENVKGMLSSNRGLDYLSILSEMDRLGYDCEWQNINSKWYVPQNRERIYTIGHLRRYGRSKIFPVEGTNGENSVFQLGNYMKTKSRENPNQGRIYDTNGISPCLNKMDGGRREPSVSIRIIGNTNPSGNGINENILDSTNLCKTLTTNKGEGIKIAIPILAPDRGRKSQNGRRVKENNDPMFTITAQDRHGIVCEYPTLPIKEATKKGFAEAKKGDSINLSMPNSKTRRGRVGLDISQTLDTNCKQGTMVVFNGKNSIYSIWSEKYQCYIAIRKLTPKECFRLQGWTDDYFEKAAFVNTDNQLYKQAGNGVTVNVVEAIGKKIKEYENN